MKRTWEKQMEDIRNQKGFTLIEILIVVILLGILATIIIPQVSVSSDDAKLNSVKMNLANLRSAIELYYYQHSNTFPGAKKATDGTAVGSDGDARTAFIEQLTKYTNAAGVAADSGSSTYAYGPYLRSGVPTNAFNDSTDVVCDYNEVLLTAKTSSGANVGWKFYPQTGILVSGDNGAHDNL
jgi:prepilin-type N-terminal cleavage/methylation domain-containing protein